MKRFSVEWPTLGLILVTYGVWLLVGTFLWPTYPVLALILLTLLTAQHSSLVHEALHGHPTRSRTLNELLVTANPGLIWPYRRFRTLHLRHHADERLTDPLEDPESYYRALSSYDALPRWVKRMLAFSNTMVGRIILAPPLGTIALITGDISLIRQGDKAVFWGWVFHVIGLIPILCAVHFLFGMPIWLYALVVAWGGASIIAVRTFAEHQWHETPEGRTIIVETSPLSLLFLNNNLHLVHHKHPTEPWYRLPRLYRQNRDHWRALNHGYVYRCYWHLFRSYAFMAKEPVVHPVLYRNKELE